MSLIFESRPNPNPVPEGKRNEILSNPGFGSVFTDHMAVATWTRTNGWQDDAVVPYGPFQLDPSAAVFHYGQEIFEGLKAYRHADGSVWTFRPEVNARRFANSARRLGLPELSERDFLTSIENLVTADQDWVPEGEGERSLYLRPFMFASEAFLGVRGAEKVTYAVIASPAGAYFASGVKPISIWITTEYSRAGAGGTGAAKCGGNYASSLLAQQQAADHGCAQVLFADAEQHTYVEELGGMNVFMITAGGELITPALTGSILEGVTRGALLELAGERGLTPVERRIPMAELLDGIADGTVTEVFACGTAAVITPIGAFVDADRTITVGSGDTVGEHTAALRNRLLDIQYGRIDDTHGWMHRLV